MASNYARRHYQEIAEIMARAGAYIDDAEPSNREVWWKFLKLFRQLFHADNPQFDAERFERACGIDHSEE